MDTRTLQSTCTESKQCDHAVAIVISLDSKMKQINLLLDFHGQIFNEIRVSQSFQGTSSSIVLQIGRKESIRCNRPRA